MMEGCLLQTDSELSKVSTVVTSLWADLMNCSYNYQTAGQRHYSALLGPHVRMCVCVCFLTQPLAILRGRCCQTGDPAGVTS